MHLVEIGRDFRMRGVAHANQYHQRSDCISEQVIGVIEPLLKLSFQFSGGLFSKRVLNQGKGLS